MRNDQVPTLISAEGVQSVLLYQSVYHYITPLQSMARGVFYSSRMVCSTVHASALRALCTCSTCGRMVFTLQCATVQVL